MVGRNCFSIIPAREAATACKPAISQPAGQSDFWTGPWGRLSSTTTTRTTCTFTMAGNWIRDCLINSRNSKIDGKSAGASADIGRTNYSRTPCAPLSIRVLRCNGSGASMEEGRNAKLDPERMDRACAALLCLRTTTRGGRQSSPERAVKKYAGSAQAGRPTRSEGEGRVGRLQE